MSKNVKVIIGIAAAVVLLLAGVFVVFSGNSKDQATQKDATGIKKDGRLRVVTEKSALGFQLTDNKVEGFNYEIVKSFADSMGMELEVNIVNDFDSALYGVIEDKYDLIALNVPNTTKLSRQVDFTMPVLNSRLMLVQFRSETDTNSNELISNHGKLKDIELTIPRHSPYLLRLENLSDELAVPLKIRELDGVTVQDLVISVSEGKIPYTICDELQARKLKRKYPNIDFSLPIGFNQQYAWVVNKHSKQLLNNLNKFLDDFLTTNSYWNLYRKYY